MVTSDTWPSRCPSFQVPDAARRTTTYTSPTATAVQHGWSSAVAGADLTLMSLHAAYYFLKIDIGDLPMPMFRHGPMLLIFDVRYVHRPNSNSNYRGPGEISGATLVWKVRGPSQISDLVYLSSGVRPPTLKKWGSGPIPLKLCLCGLGVLPPLRLWTPCNTRRWSHIGVVPHCFFLSSTTRYITTLYSWRYSRL